MGKGRIGKERTEEGRYEQPRREERIIKKREERHKKEMEEGTSTARTRS